jgi:hypothetical protein
MLFRGEVVPSVLDLLLKIVKAGRSDKCTTTVKNCWTVSSQNYLGKTNGGLYNDGVSFSTTSVLCGADLISPSG